MGKLLLAEIPKSRRQESVLSHLPPGCEALLGKAFPAALDWERCPGITPERGGEAAERALASSQKEKGLNGLRPELYDSLLAIVLFPQRFWCPGFCGLITVCSKWS